MKTYIKKRLFMLFIVATVNALFMYFFQNPENTDKISTSIIPYSWYGTEATVFFSLLFVFSSLMFILICTLSLPIMDLHRIKKILRLVELIHVDIIFLMLLSLTGVFVMMTFKDSMITNTIIKSLVSVTLLMFFIYISDGIELRKILSTTAEENAKCFEKDLRNQAKERFNKNPPPTEAEPKTFSLKNEEKE